MIGRIPLPAVVLLVIAGAAAGGGGHAQPPSSASLPPQVGAYLNRHIHLTQRELEALQTGGVIARTVETNDRREIAAFGLAKIVAAPEPYIDGVRKLTWLRKSGVVAAVAHFSTPPRVADLADLVVDAQDIAALRECKVGDCDVRLAAAEIRRVQAGVDWHSPRAGQQAAALFKEILVDHARAYLAGGDAALADFQDHEHPVRPADEVREILTRSPYLRDSSPEFHQHLRTFPSSPLQGAENSLYWSKDRFGAKPVISATHLTILVRPRDAGPTLIASKQIYASHYFDASLGLSAVFDAPAADGPAFYLAYVNRTRTRSLDSALRALARGSVKRRARDGVERMLRGLKRTLEKR